jgi:aspartyl-tRNA(Asn)/glutamyl-tRNA(Gln) amidotransferase subunit B
MEEGSLRCDANVSVKLPDDTKLGQKVEIKNMNSFKNVQKAIDYEIHRQIDVLRTGNKINSETRTFNPSTGKTYGMRVKEELNDYRYFSDPDLSPVEISTKWLEDIKAEMPALPQQLAERFKAQYLIPEYDTLFLTETREIALYYEEACKHTKNYKMISNWMMTQVKSFLNDRNCSIDEFPISPEKLAEMINFVTEGKISHTTAAKEIYPSLLDDPELSLTKYITEKNLGKDIDDDGLVTIIKEVIESYPDKVMAYRKGRKGLLGMFMGEVMKKSKGKADPEKAQELILETLKE